MCESRQSQLSFTEERKIADPDHRLIIGRATCGGRLGLWEEMLEAIQLVGIDQRIQSVLDGHTDTLTQNEQIKLQQRMRHAIRWRIYWLRDGTEYPE